MTSHFSRLEVTFLDYENTGKNAMQPFNQKASKKEQFLTITALSGEFPASYWSRLYCTAEYGRNLKYRLISEKLIQDINANGLKGHVLTKKGTDYLLDKNTLRFRYIEKRVRHELTKRYRKQLFAKTYCSLLNSEIEFLCDTKPYIYLHGHGQAYSVGSVLMNTDLLNQNPVFYSSIEIKHELENYVQQIRNSAMMGLILNKTDSYILYNIDKNKNPLSYATELKANILINNGTFLQSNNKNHGNSKAIFLVADFYILEELVLGNRQKKKKPCKVIFQEPFRHIYIVPENSDGDIQLMTICHPELRKMIDNTFINAFKAENQNFKTVNDGFDSDGNPVINSCCFDIMRLLKFKRGLLNNGIKGRILCYDFQIDIISKLMKPADVIINNIKISDVREMINNENS